MKTAQNAWLSINQDSAKACRSTRLPTAHAVEITLIGLVSMTDVTQIKDNAPL
jgi:hypothetical protein